MEKQTIDDVRRVIIEILGNQPAGTATGPRLGSVLRYKLETFRAVDFGVPTLKAFIQKFVPEIQVISNSPTEVLFTLRESNSEISPNVTDQSAEPIERSEDPGASADRVSEVRLPSNIWFAFVAASSKTKLVIHRHTGEMKLKSAAGEPLPEEWITIDSLPAEEHSAIAADFLMRIPQNHRSRIQGLIDSGPSWWKAHFSALEELGLGAAFRRFHSQQVLQRLNRIVREKVGRELRELRLPDGRSVSEYTPPIRPTAIPLKARSGLQLQTQPSGVSKKEDILRSLAERLVRGMSCAELRRIKVALGDVVDLL